MSLDNPCLTCGACCATFRVAFYWAEADDAPGGTVPANLTHSLPPNRRCMKGTDTYEPRCVALDQKHSRARHDQASSASGPRSRSGRYSPVAAK